MCTTARTNSNTTNIQPPNRLRQALAASAEKEVAWRADALLSEFDTAVAIKIKMTTIGAAITKNIRPLPVALTAD
jgi:hypothetical protein